MKRKIFLPLFIILALSGLSVNAQTPLPEVAVRFSNPYYDCPTQTYCLDVEFMTNTPGKQLYGVNVRFFYDDDVLEYLSMGDFETGYASPADPIILTGNGQSGEPFGMSGPAEFFNGLVQRVAPSPVFLTAEWKKIFEICFHVDDPAAIEIDSFCPTVVWDLRLSPDPNGYWGFMPGDDGVVITVAGIPESAPSTEQVVQFNWEYDQSGVIFGNPVDTDCIPTTCGYEIPVSNWALFLGIGLMVLATLFIYRRRIS